MEVVQGEESVGIQVYTCKEFPGFAGILKQRYTDFIVREIDTNGNVAYLQELNAKAVENKVFAKDEGEDSSSGLDIAELADKFMEKMCSLVTLDEDRQNGLRGFLTSCLSKADECPKEYVAFPCTVKETRTAAHMAIKTLAPVRTGLSVVLCCVVLCCVVKCCEVL
jgi:tRNA pseudouridine13 synthase